MEALRIPPAGAFVAIGDEYSARLVPLRGGTPAERRVARRVLQGVGYGVVGRIAFSRRGGRRVVEVVPFASAPVLGLPARDSAWVAGEVRQEIVRRLHGQDAAPTGRGRYATLSRRGDALLRRAVAAGWDVRSVQGWNLGPGGAFIVTLRLTERELLDGRTGWVEDIAADRHRERYGVRFDVEAPDGTLVAGGGETFRSGTHPHRRASTGRRGSRSTPTCCRPSTGRSCSTATAARASASATPPAPVPGCSPTATPCSRRSRIRLCGRRRRRVRHPVRDVPRRADRTSLRRLCVADPGSLAAPARPDLTGSGSFVSIR